MAKVADFHTDTVWDYEPEEQWRFHDNDECDYGARITADGNDVPGAAGRKLCARCEALAEEESD